MAELDVDAVIGQLYAGAVESAQWGAALTSIARLVGASATACLVQDAVTEQVFDYRMIGTEDTSWADVYPLYYHALDPAYRVIHHGSPGQMYPMHQYISEQAVNRSEYFQDFYLKGGLRYSCGGSVLYGGKRLIMSVHRPFGAPTYDEHDVDKLQRVLKHLPQVFRIREMSAQEAHSKLLSIAALDALPQALLIVDACLRIHYLNPQARRVLDASVALRAGTGALTMSDPQLRNELAHRVHEACREKAHVHAAPLYSVDGNGRPVLEISVLPLRPQLAEGVVSAHPMALIVLRCPFAEAPRKSAQRTARPYHLSPAEMALAQALVAGMTPGEYAASAAVKISTVRSQIQSILGKTGTRRTTEAVVLLSALPVIGQ